MQSTQQEAANPSNTDPFLKWAGGKRWLINSDVSVAPPKSANYFEPFLGSGAVFFALSPKRGTLSDVNERLIETYQAISDDWHLVLDQLKIHQRKHSHQYYYEERSRFHRKPHTRSAQFIYLNRTCWNGLYRVNLAGKFNVPKGTKSSVLFPNDNFQEISNRISKISLNHSDFEETVDKSKRGDFIFVDPPYTVKHNNNGFVKYNENLFSWFDQLRLKDCLTEAHKRGAQITMTNAAHSSIAELYSERFWKKEVVSRNSVLSGKPEFRSPTSELIVRNWT